VTRQNPIPENDPRAKAWRKARKYAGGPRPLAKHFEISPAAVQQWIICPAERVLGVERMSGVSRYALRPDVFGEKPGPAGSRRDINVDDALAEFGKRKLAEAIDVPVEEIEAWPTIPPHLVLKIEAATGLSRHILRPDIFGEEPEREVA